MPCTNNVNQGHIITNSYLNTESPCEIESNEDLDTNNTEYGSLCGADQVGSTGQNSSIIRDHISDRVNRDSEITITNPNQDSPCEVDQLDSTGQITNDPVDTTGGRNYNILNGEPHCDVDLPDINRLNITNAHIDYKGEHNSNSTNKGQKGDGGVDKVDITGLITNKAKITGSKCNHREKQQETPDLKVTRGKTGTNRQMPPKLKERKDRRSKGHRWNPPVQGKGRKPRRKMKNQLNKKEETNKTVELKLLAANCRSLANKKASVREIFDQARRGDSIRSKHKEGGTKNEGIPGLQ